MTTKPSMAAQLARRPLPRVLASGMIDSNTCKVSHRGAHHKNHRTGGKREAKGQEWLGQRNNASPEKTAKRLNHPAELTPEEAAGLGEAHAAQRQ